MEMLQAYKEYKEWWIIYCSYDWAKQYYGNAYIAKNKEEYFYTYWSSLAHYKIFEILLDWVENPNIPEGN